MDSQTINLGLYTFSSLVQADAAIFGLFAVFLVYRLQALESNMQTALNVGRSQNSPARSEFEQLVLGVPMAQVHAIFFRYSRTIYLDYLKTVAFTPKWKTQAIRSSVPVIVTIVLHASFCCIGLYYTSYCGLIFGFGPSGRIVFILISFAILLLLLAFTGYRSFSLIGRRSIDPVPKVNLQHLSDEAVVALFPSQRGVSHLYEVEDPKGNRFVQLSIDAAERYYFHPVKVTSNHDLTITYQIGLLAPEDLKRLLLDLRNTPDKYWPNT